MNEVYDRLDEIGLRPPPWRAASPRTTRSASTAADQNKATKEFSGGWRMRISLAQVLFMTPDLLLLDERHEPPGRHALTWRRSFARSGDRRGAAARDAERGFLSFTKTTRRPAQ